MSYHPDPSDTSGASTAVRRCRGCAGTALTHVLDLGLQPACDQFPPIDAAEPDPRWPLGLVLCGECHLLQLDHVSPVAEEPLAVESASVRAHAVGVVDRLLQRIGAGHGITVREFASNHGGSWADRLRASGCLVESVDGGFAADASGQAAQSPAGSTTSMPVELVIDNHSIIHAEDLEAELARRVAVLAPDGLLVIEFHHALRQLEDGQFDTVRHGHPVYLSLHAWAAACARHGLSVVDAWEEDIYGGCLVVVARRGAHEPGPAVAELLEREIAAGLTSPARYALLDHLQGDTVARLRAYLDAAHAAGEEVAAYGAGSKACTMLGVAGVDRSDLRMVADLAPGKQGRRIPATGIPIVSPGELVDARPDHVVILTWDIAAEVVAQLRRMGLEHTRFVVPLPVFATVG